MRVDLPGPGEVRIRVVASGVCQTDLAAVRDARSYPVLLGHEGAGVVERVGAGVSRLSVGDHVVVNWQPRCGQCRACRGGRSAFCTDVRGTAAPRVHLDAAPLDVLLHAGTFCPLVVVPEAGAVRVSAEIPLERAALLGCAVATGVGAALYSADVRAGDSVVVVGTGGVGLNVLQGARLRAAGVLIAVDPDPRRLALAPRFGATACVDPEREDVEAAVRLRTEGRGADHVFEVVGQVDTMALSLRLLGRGGTLTLLGAAARDASWPFLPRQFLSQQQRLHGCIYGDVDPERDLPQFAQWYLSGELELDALHGRTVALADVPALFAAPSPGPGVRTIIRLEEPS